MQDPPGHPSGQLDRWVWLDLETWSNGRHLCGCDYLGPWFSQCGPQPGNLSITWEIRQVLRPQQRPTVSGTLCVGQTIRIHEPPTWFGGSRKLANHWLRLWKVERGGKNTCCFSMFVLSYFKSGLSLWWILLFWAWLVHHLGMAGENVIS